MTDSAATNMTMEACQELYIAKDDVWFAFWLNGVGISVVGLLGIFGNIASMKVLSDKRMRSPTNFILIALASSDLILIVTSILLFALPTLFPFNGSAKNYFYIFRPQMSVVVYPLAMMAHTVSVYMTLLISLERYIAVCHPLKARSLCTHSRTKLCIFTIVLLSILYNLPKAFEIKLIGGSHEDYGLFFCVSASEFRMNNLYITVYIHWMYFVFMNFIPLSGIIIFNFMIHRQVQLVNQLRLKLTSKQIQDIKLTTMLFCVVIVFLSCKALAVVTNTLESFGNIYCDRLTRTSNFLVTLNSSANFIIYVVCVKKFRRIFARQLTSLFWFQGGQVSTSSS